VQAGTYTNFGNAVVTAGLNVIKYNGSAWSVDQAIAIDAEPTQGSDHLVKSGGVLNSIIQNGPAFDLSAYNAQGGVLATYADLSAALTALNALPADFKKGGMSMKFVLTSDNKYVQYRLMTDSWSTVVADWQGVDEKPTDGSKNLVKSEGTFTDINTRAIQLCSPANAFNSAHIRTDNKGINSAGAVVDYTQGTAIMTKYYLIPQDCKKINIEGLVLSGNGAIRLSKTPDDEATGSDIEIINNTRSFVSVDITTARKQFKYIVISVYRGDAGSTPALDDVSIKFLSNEMLTSDDVSYNKTLLINSHIAPVKGCVCFEMDVNGNNSFNDYFDEYVSTLKEYGVPNSSFLVEDRVLETYGGKLLELSQQGNEVGIHSDPDDSIGYYNSGTHPTVAQFREIFAGYMANFLSAGLTPFGWVTSMGKIVDELLTPLKDYVGYAHTLPNKNVGDSAYLDWINNKQTDRYQILRLGLELNDDAVTTDEDTIITNACAAIDYAVQNKAFIVFYTHSYKNDSISYTLRERVFKAILAHLQDYIDSYDVVVGTCLELSKYYY
jgi:hypothetical protein